MKTRHAPADFSAHGPGYLKIMCAFIKTS